MRIPKQGLQPDAVLAALEGYRQGDMPWRNGRTWAYVYDPGPAVEGLIKQAFAMYLSDNGLDPTVFPSALRLDNDVVAMAAAHLQGDAHTVGHFTSGGTESIMLAVMAARDWARAKRPHITAPEMILPSTAHAAFQKAAHYLCVKPVVVPVDPASFRADVAAIRQAITPNTILLVGSAISYAHGVVDPIREIGDVARTHDLLLHVDGCMGGFLLPYFRRLGATVPDFEFNVPGVTSISMDLHKYAFAAKGASVILYRDNELRKYQMYACSTWTGYTVINTTIQSTKSIGPVAAAWAALHAIGDDGYLEIARQVLDATRRIADGITRIPGLRLLGYPDMNLLAFTSETASVFHIIDEMKVRGWYVQPQLAYGPSKENIHLSINPNSVQWVDAMLRDLRECVEVAAQIPPDPVVAQVRTMAESIDPAMLDAATLSSLLGAAGAQGTTLPQRMAGINEVLNVLPPGVREELLKAYLGELYHGRD